MKSETEMKPLLVSLKQVRQMLGIGEEAIKGLISTRGFPPPIDIRIARLRWRLSDVEDWVKNCKVRRWN